MKIPVVMLCGLLLLGACDQEPPPPPPTWAISAPTLQASPVVLPLLPTSPAFEDEFSPIRLTAAALPRDSALPPALDDARAPGVLANAITITLPSGALHPGRLYPAVNTAGTLLTPGALLLADDPALWGELPARLRELGVTVIVTALPPAATFDDFNTLLISLGEASDPGHLAVAGIGTAADGAAAGCAAALQCDALLSIGASGNAVAAFAPRLAPRPVREENSLSLPLDATAVNALADWLLAGLG